jgi:hypothetical protein
MNEKKPVGGHTWEPSQTVEGPFVVLAVKEGDKSIESELIAVIHSDDPEEAKKRAALCAGSKQMYSTLRAIKARIQGEWDNPHLMAMGELMTDPNADVLRFVQDALDEVKGNL